MKQKDLNSALQPFKKDVNLLLVLANPKRLELLYLLDNQKMSVSQIMSMLNLTQANCSQHLASLRKANLVKSEKNGKERKYYIADHRLITFLLYLRTLTSTNRELDIKLINSQKTSIASILPLANDPVCGMQVSIPLANYHFKHQGKIQYFCGSGCKKQYIKKISYEK